MSLSEPIRQQNAWDSDVMICWFLPIVSGAMSLAKTVTFSTKKYSKFAWKKKWKRKDCFPMTVQYFNLPRIIIKLEWNDYTLQIKSSVSSSQIFSLLLTIQAFLKRIWTDCTKSGESIIYSIIILKNEEKNPMKNQYTSRKSGPPVVIIEVTLYEFPEDIGATG